MRASNSSVAPRTFLRRPSTPRTYVPVRCARRARRETRRRKQQSPSEREIVLVRPCRRPAMLVLLPASMALARVACTAVLIRFPAQISSLLAFSVASHGGVRGERSERARTYHGTGSARTPQASSRCHRRDRSPQTRFLNAKAPTFRTMRSAIARAAACVRAPNAKARGTNHRGQGSMRGHYVPTEAPWVRAARNAGGRVHHK